MFGIPRLEQFLLQHHRLSGEALIEKVYSYILEYTEESSFLDDVTMIALEIP